MKKLIFVTLLLSLFTILSAQTSIYTPYMNDEVESSFMDMGKMWTYDDIPFDYLDKEYGFRPDQKWLDDVRLSALQFGRGCSASFISEDGLIMTNHHCGRDDMRNNQKKDEDLFKTGFFAETLEDERKIPGLYVDQLILIEDVTEEVQAAFNSKRDNNEKIKARTEKINEIQKRYAEETELICKVVTLYNGGKFSLYAYKRFDDIRLVMAPEFQVASTGWDWDNFTYPRYELDYMFFRAYEDDKPAKVKNYFTWSKDGAAEDELVFISGRPGNTDRLLSVDELISDNKNIYTSILMIYNSLYEINRELYEKYPDQESKYLNRIMSLGNTRKSIAGGIASLDEYTIKRKRHFEQKLQEAIKDDSELNKKYGDLFGALKTTVEELQQYYPDYYAYNLGGSWGPNHIRTAKKLVKLYDQMQLPEGDRQKGYLNGDLESVLGKIKTATFDDELDIMLLEKHAFIMEQLVGTDHKLYKMLYGGKTGKQAIEYSVKNSVFASAKKLQKITLENLEAYINSEDGFINYAKFSNKNYPKIDEAVVEIFNTLKVLNQQLGEAYAAVYGNNIAPDATSTLRFTDGRVKGYEYNGTIAPAFTTYFGMYDRYHSFGGDIYPWGLPEKWKTVPEGLDLSTPVGFASDNDIVGGNSGSAVFNKNAEIVGVVHDGNMESLAGSSIFLPAKNRAVSSDSRGIMASLVYVYKAERLIKEINNSKITE